MEKRRIPRVNKSFYTFIKNRWFVMLNDACLPDKKVTMQIFHTAINVPTATLDNLFVHVPRCRALNGHDLQKLPDNFGEHMVNFETIWSGYARVTGIGSVCADWGAGQYTDLGEKQGKGGNGSEVALKMNSYKRWRKLSGGGEEEKAKWPFQRERKLQNQRWKKQMVRSLDWQWRIEQLRKAIVCFHS